MVALHALSKYGAATFNNTGKTARVTIQSLGSFSRDFQVDNNNRLLLQQISLSPVPGEYDITATGERCVYLQVRLLGQVRAEDPQQPCSLKSLNSGNNGENQRKTQRSWEESRGKEKHRFLSLMFHRHP